MELLKQKIREEGIVRPGNILMINSFPYTLTVHTKLCRPLRSLHVRL